MNKYAILIGNGNFPNEPKLNTLRCPLLDVDGLEQVLKNEARGDFNEVVVLKDQRHHEIERGLNRMLNQAQKQDLVLVYYSGHGKQSKSGQLYLTSLDTEVTILNSTAVGLNKVYEFINDSACQKIILILDCCYSGVAGRAFKGDIESELKQINTRSRGTYLITASTEIQVAVENSEDDYSLFTKHLITGLETGAADKNTDGQITIDELYQYVHDKVLAENKNQQPTKTSKGERGELVIAKSGHDLREEVINKIRPHLLKLSQQDDEFIAVLSDTVTWVELPEQKWSSLQKQKYDLLKKLLGDSLTPMSFVIAWYKLNPLNQPVDEIKKPEKPKEAIKKSEIKKTPVNSKKTKEPTVIIVEKPWFKKRLTLAILGVSTSFGMMIYQNYESIMTSSDSDEKTFTADGWEIKKHYQVKEGLVKDTNTGLMWMRCSIGQTWEGATCTGKPSKFTWKDALKIPHNFEYAGYSDWRVPTIKELNTLVYCSNGKIIQYEDDGFDSIETEGSSDCQSDSRSDFQEPTINQLVFLNTTAARAYWSSSPNANVSGNVWGVDFSNGNDYGNYRNYTGSLRLVRSGQ